MTIRIKQIIPVTGSFPQDDPSLVYCRKHLDEKTVVDVEAIASGSASIEKECDVVRNAPYVLELCRKAEADGYDAIYIDCFADPAVRAARELVNIPVFGGFEPAMYTALGLGDKVGIVTLGKSAVPMMDGNIARYHLEGRLTGIRTMDVEFTALEDPDALCRKLIPVCRRSVEEDGAAVLVLGCTGMIDLAENVEKALAEAGFDVPVIEGAQAALNLLEMYVKLHKKHSRITYTA